MIYSYKAFDELIQILQDASDWCEALRYSPSEEMLAAGSHDFNIYIYQVSQNDDDNDEEKYMLLNIVKDRHTAPITALDWSCDSTLIRAIDSHYFKNFYNIEKGRQVHDGQQSLTDPSIWWTHSCKLGWDVNGVYAQGAQGTDIHSVSVN